MAKIEWVRRIYEDGWHNAFTDFQFFKGRYYICFRNGLSPRESRREGGRDLQR